MFEIGAITRQYVIAEISKPNCSHQINVMARKMGKL